MLVHASIGAATEAAVKIAQFALYCGSSGVLFWVHVNKQEVSSCEYS